MTAVVVAIMILVSKRRRKNLSTTGSSIYSGPYTNTAYSHSSMSRRSWTAELNNPKISTANSSCWDLFLPLVVLSVRLGQENSTTVSWEPLLSSPLLCSALLSWPVVVIQWPVSISTPHISAITFPNKTGLVSPLLYILSVLSPEIFPSGNISFWVLHFSYC